MSYIIKKNVSLKDLTTFRIGGNADYFVRVSNKEDLKEVVEYGKANRLPIFILGGGSDILVSDKGFRGLVLQYDNKIISFKDSKKHSNVTAGSAVGWDDLVKECVKRKLQGIECLSGIPGSVGAAPVQNIGAYGQELKDYFVKLTAYDTKTAESVSLKIDDCKFGYRESIFKNTKYRGRYIILDITLKLSKNNKPTLLYASLISLMNEKKIVNPTLTQVRNMVLELREQKLENPKKIGNAGSFFKNPILETKDFEKIQKKYPQIVSYPTDDGKVKLFAGWLIDQSGWKGKKYKNVMVSSKNALIIVNPEEKGTAEEVKDLANIITDDVYKKFGVKLEPEIHFIGF